jgi:outer membrane protein OmpA-like peptidoglycan-associated protein
VAATTSGADAAAYAALLAEKDAALAAAAAEAEALREAANKKPVEVVVEKQVDVYVGGKTVVFFSLGSTKLTDHEKITLDLKADQIKNGPAKKVYMIEGHADSKTGTAATNLRVSEARAKAVYDYLIEKGVKAEQLQYKGVGDKAEPFTTAETNRVAIID